MGADGGCKISKVKDIKKNWKKIKHGLINELERELNMATSDSFNDKWTREHHPTYIKAVKGWPNQVLFKSNQEICDYLKLFPSCDCPYLFDEKYIVTAEGDNICDLHDTMTMYLPGESIETWT